MTEQTLREQVEGLNPKKKLAAILRGDSGGTATTHQQQTHELLCRFALCSACSSKLQPLALRSLVLEVRKGRTRGGGLRQHQAPSPPPPRSTKEVEERPWKRGSAWANRAIAPMNQGLPRQHISCCSCALINVIYIFF